MTNTVKRVIWAVVIGLLVAFIMAYRFHIYYFILRAITPKTKKTENNEKIRELHPIFALKVARFVNDLERSGHTVTITSGYRSEQKQAQLYNSGQTPAPPLSSYHNYGMAIDVNVDNLKQASSVSDWQQVANLGKTKYGFRWGGDFQNNWDKVHFDLGNKYTIEQLKNLYLLNQVVNKKFVKVL